MNFTILQNYKNWESWMPEIKKVGKNRNSSHIALARRCNSRLFSWNPSTKIEAKNRGGGGNYSEGSKKKSWGRKMWENAELEDVIFTKRATDGCTHSRAYNFCLENFLLVIIYLSNLNSVWPCWPTTLDLKTR